MRRIDLRPTAHLLAHTSELAIATGIANIFNRHPGSMRQAQMTLAEQSGARPVESRRLGCAGAAQRRVGQSVRQGIAADAALRRPDEREPAPAGRAQARLALDQIAAAEATRRQHQVEETVQDTGDGRRGVQRAL